MRLDKDDLQRIRDRVNIVDVVGRYVVLERRGDRWWGLSPFKTEKTPSFTVQPDKGYFYCFSTQKGGDIFTFLMEMEGLSFAEAVEQLAPQAGIELSPHRDDPAQRDRAALSELYQRVAQSFVYLLRQDQRGRAARDYLESRGISDETARRFVLGYAPHDSRWLHQFLRSKSYSSDFLTRSGFFSRRNEQVCIFWNRIMFPIINERQAVVAFGARALDPDARGKYINSPETLLYRKKETLFGLAQAVDAIRTAKNAYLVEGNFDVLAMHQAGVSATVAPLGTAFTPEQARLLRRWTNEITIVFDGDSAGLEATVRAAIVAEEAGLDCYTCAIPSGEDPAALLQQSGIAAVQATLAQRRPVFDHLIDVLRPEPDLILPKLFPYINIVRSEVSREQYLGALAGSLNASLSAVQADFQRWRKGDKPENTVASKPRVGQSVTINRELALMLAVSQDSELFAYLRTQIDAEDLPNKHARDLFVVLEDAFRHGEPFPQGVLARLRDDSFRSLVLEKLTSGEYTAYSKHSVEQAVRVIRIAQAEQKQREIERSLRAVQGADAMAIARIMEHKIAVDQELRRLKGEIQ